MSHYVFLNRSAHRRMPSGSAGEWRDFWQAPGAELEAKNGLPLFWWCLFGEADILRAKLIDDVDIGGPDGERAELEAEEGFVADAAYPYLVTGQEEALARLAQRRPVVLDAIGQVYAPVYDAFSDLMRDAFGPFILVRTSGLPDPMDAEPGMRQMAAEMDQLGQQPGPAFRAKVADFRQWQTQDPVWLLSGAGDGWPSPEIEAAFPSKRSGAGRNLTDPGAAEGLDAKPPGRGRGGAPDWIANWVGPLLAGLAAVALYIETGSVLLGALGFAAGVGCIVGLVLLWPKRRI